VLFIITLSTRGLLLRKCAGVLRASVGIGVKGSAKGLSGRLSGSVEGVGGWVEYGGFGSLMET